MTSARMLAQGGNWRGTCRLLVEWNVLIPSATLVPAQAMDGLCGDGCIRAKQVHLRPNEIEHDLAYSGIGKRFEIFL